MAIVAERRRLEARLGILAEVEKELRGLLQTQADLPLNQPAPTPPLSEPTNRESYDNAKVKELLVNEIKTGEKTTEQLTELALRAGFNFGEKSPSRVIHFDLLNLKNAGLIELSENLWKYIEKKLTA